MRAHLTHSSFEQFPFIFGEKFFWICDPDQKQSEFHIRLLKFLPERMRVEELKTVQESVAHEFTYAISHERLEDVQLFTHNNQKSSSIAGLQFSKFI